MSQHDLAMCRAYAGAGLVMSQPHMAKMWQATAVTYWFAMEILTMEALNDR